MQRNQWNWGGFGATVLASLSSDTTGDRAALVTSASPEARDGTFENSTPSRPMSRTLAHARKETVVTTDRKARLKETLWRETKTMLWLAFYLFAFLAALAGYRAVLLGEGGAGAWPLFHCAVEALVLAKVMLIGNALRLGERLFQRRMISKIVSRAFAFAIFALVFSTCEELVTGWLRGRTSAEMWHELQNFGPKLILARGVVLFIFFIPLFLLWEISRALGEGKLLALVLSPPPPPPPSHSHGHAEASASGSR